MRGSRWIRSWRAGARFAKIATAILKRASMANGFSRRERALTSIRTEAMDDKLGLMIFQVTINQVFLATYVKGLRL